LNGILLTGHLYEDFSKNTNITSSDIENVWFIFEQEIKKCKRTLTLVLSARKVIQEYLKEHNITFSDNDTLVF